MLAPPCLAFPASFLANLFPTPGKTQSPLTVAAVSRGEAPEFPASHFFPVAWCRRSLHFRGRIPLCWWVGSRTYCSVLPRTRYIQKEKFLSLQHPPQLLDQHCKVQEYKIIDFLPFSSIKFTVITTSKECHQYLSQAPHV